MKISLNNLSSSIKKIVENHRVMVTTQYYDEAGAAYKIPDANDIPNIQGYTRTDDQTINLPEDIMNHENKESMWGVLFTTSVYEGEYWGMQIYTPIQGPFANQQFLRLTFREDSFDSWIRIMTDDSMENTWSWIQDIEDNIEEKNRAGNYHIMDFDNIVEDVNDITEIKGIRATDENTANLPEDLGDNPWCILETILDAQNDGYQMLIPEYGEWKGTICIRSVTDKGSTLGPWHWILDTDSWGDALETESKTIIGAINELFQDVDSGKQLIADAIGDPTITKDSTFAAMSEAIRNNSTKCSSGTITLSSDVNLSSNCVLNYNLDFTPTVVFITIPTLILNANQYYYNMVISSNTTTNYSPLSLELKIGNISASSCSIIRTGSTSGIILAGQINYYAIG